MGVHTPIELSKLKNFIFDSRQMVICLILDGIDHVSNIHPGMSNINPVGIRT